jgi:SAM-dependent methyltransferase
MTPMTPPTWADQLTVTARWLDRRDAALNARRDPRGVGPSIALLYLEFLDHCRRTGPVLDIGCGRGERRRWFPSGYVGLDPVVRRVKPGLPFVCGRAESLPWGDAAFPAVLSVEAFDHFADPARAAAEALRVLRPGGQLLVFVLAGTAEAAAEAAVHLNTFDAEGLRALFAPGLRRLRLAHDSTHLLLLGERN